MSAVLQMAGVMMDVDRGLPQSLSTVQRNLYLEAPESIRVGMWLLRVPALMVPIAN